MDFEKIIEKIRSHPESAKMGMIATHLGIVRGNSLNGRDVSEIEAAYDHEKIREIASYCKALAGIVDVVIEVNEGILKIGDIIMFVAVGGDVRDHVFPALVKTVDRIKKEAGKKKEFYR